jgi:hypothetical protein
MSDWKTFVLTGVGASVVSYLCYTGAEYFECPVKEHWAVVGTTGALGALLGSGADAHLRK